MIQAPLFSIITPTFNHQNYISDCIKSVQNQTYTNWEMIIVNDGSTDETEKVIVEFAKNDDRIKYHYQKNIGVFRLNETYNFALNQSIGKYISILEGDDVWEFDKLQNQIDAFEKDKNIVLAWGRAYNTTLNLSEIQKTVPQKKINTRYFNIPRYSSLEVLYFDYCIPALTITVRKEILTKIGGFQKHKQLPAVDFPTVLALVKEGDFYYDSNILGSQRRYPNQTTKKYTIEMSLVSIEIIKNDYKNIPIEIRNQFSFSEIDLEHHFNNYLLKSYFVSGKSALRRREFKKSFFDFKTALFYPASFQLLFRFKALVGLVLSKFRLSF